MSKLQEIKKRADAATEGPWVCSFVKDGDEIDSFDVSAFVDGPLVCEMDDVSNESKANQQFIAHARADVPWLLERLEEAEYVVELLLNPSPTDPVHSLMKADTFLKSLTPKPEDD